MLDALDDVERLDPVAAWGDAHDRVCDLLDGLGPAEADLVVPATPDWSVRDLTAHVVGVGADTLSGDEDPDHAAWWTAKHVEERAGRDLGALVAEWRALAAPLQQHMREHGPRPLADLTIHEQDLRGALGRHGARDTAAQTWVVSRMLGRAAEALARSGDGVSLCLRSPSGAWSSRPDVRPDACDVEVRASDFDLARALTTRRTRAQLESWTVRGDLDRVLAAFTLLGPLPARELPC